MAKLDKDWNATLSTMVSMSQMIDYSEENNPFRVNLDQEI